MRSKNVLWGSVSTGLLSLITMISGFIIPRLVIMTYGSDVNGLSNSVTQFISYFSLLETGLAGSAIFALYKPIADSDYDRINAIVSSAKCYYYKIGVAYFGLAVALSVVYGFFFDSVMSCIETMFLVLAISAGGALEFITMSKYRVFLTAMQKTSVISFVGVISIAFKTLVMWLLIKLNFNIIVVKLFGSLAILIRSVLLSLYVRKKFAFVDYNAHTKNVKIEQRGDVLLMQLLGTAQHAFPTIAMTICGFSFSQISVYSVYSMVTAGIVNFMNIFLNGSIYSTFGNVISKNEYGILKKTLGEFEVGCYFAISVLFGATAVLYMPFIGIYTTGMADVNYNQPVIACLLIINSLIASIKNPLSSMIQAAGHYRATRWRTIIQTTIAIVMPLALAKPFGIAGIIIGTICSHLYRIIDIIIYVPTKITRTSSLVSLKRILVSVVSIIVIYFSFTLLVDIKADNYILWAVYGCITVCWAIVVSCVFNILFNRAELIGLCFRLKNILFGGSYK